MKIEVCHVDANGATRIAVEVGEDATLSDAIAVSGIIERLSLARDALTFGIFGKRADLDARLCEGDRVEVYRPLIVDPKEARRRRVEKKRVEAVRLSSKK